jgi:hypothetical protein
VSTHKPLRMIVSGSLVAALCALLAVPVLLAQTSVPKAQVPQVVRTIKVLDSKDAVEIEVEASDPILPQTKILTGPDRLVVDFPNAVPGNQLRSQSIDQGEVKDLRVGLLQSKPPVTRVVLDLKTAQSYQIFPYGRTVIIKITGSGAEASPRVSTAVPATAPQPALVAASYAPRAEPVQVETKVDTSDQPLLDVTFRNGLLGIRADKVTLAEVLFAVQHRTGAEVLLAAGAEQEKIVADIAPAPAAEVLTRLLNGSNFNFLILSAANDPKHVDRVILSVRPESGFVSPPPPARVQDGAAEEPESSSANPQPTNTVPAPTQAPAQPEAKTPTDVNAPDQ